MDKNPHETSLNEYNEIEKLLKIKSLNSVVCMDPFVKITFLEKLINKISSPIIYLDFDLLYSGYVKSGLLSSNDKVLLYNPTKKSWNTDFKNILLELSKEKVFVIIDSLNGFYNLFDEKDGGRLVNSFIMLLGCIARDSGSTVLFSGVTRAKEEKLVLVPSGRHLFESKTITKLFLDRKKTEIIIKIIQ